MKAYNLYGVGDLRYEDVEMPKLQEDWCIVKVRASGICSSDIPRIYKKGTYHFPTIPGHEFAGEIFISDDSSEVGKPVGIFPLIPCQKCEQCINKKYEMCEQYDYIGSRRDGGFAEYVAVPKWNIIYLPSSISFEEAAMLEPLSVALHAVKRADIKTGDSFAAIGTGMIGIASAQWAKHLGAKEIFIVGRNEDKRALVNSLGKEFKYVNITEEALPSVDVALEAVGSSQSIEETIKSVKSGGRVVLMGNPSGEIILSQDVYWKILRKQLYVIGTWNSSYEGKDKSDWTETLKCLEQKTINASPMISHRVGQDEVTNALEMMREHRQSYCKVMTLWN